IRSIVVSGNRASVQAGAGIVADSIPEREYQETAHKMGAMLEAISSASNGGRT
ncbi:MAG: chorismate-binding protein, partial [Methanobacteriota archaeon]